MRSRVRVFVCGVLLLILTPESRAQRTFQSGEILTPDRSILIGKLENGLTYYIKENTKPGKRADLRLVVKAGSVLEDDDQQGLAHFVEHMAFNGTKNFPKQDLINYLEKSGVRFGPDLNAYTNFDESVYMLQVPTDSPIVMKKGFQILEEWSHEISFDDAEIDRERGVLVEEWRLRRGADWRVWTQHVPVQLYQSRYAERIVIGKREILESCPYDAIRRFYRDWYRPDLMAIVAVGDFNKAEIENLIREHFSGLKNPQDEEPRPHYPIPDHKETLVSIVTDPELVQTSVGMIFKRDSHDTRTVAEYRADMIGNLYDHMLYARLQELTQKSNPPFIYAYCGDGRFFGRKQAYNLGAGVRENSILEGLDAVLTEAFRVKQYGFTSSELERQKASSLRYFERAYLERDKTESRQYAEEYIRNFLTNETIPGIETELALYQQYIPGIIVEEVNRLAAERLTPGNRVVTISVPEKDSVKVPTEAGVLAVINAASTEQLEPYVDRFMTEPLMIQRPIPGKVIDEKEIPSLGVTEWKLSNGARVVLKPTDFKNDEILFSAYSNGGTSLVEDRDYISATEATSIIGLSGIGKFDYVSLQKMLMGKVVSVSPILSMLSEGFHGNASPQDIETLLQLVYLYATSPRRDTAAFASLLSRQRAWLENRSVSPEGAFNDTLQVTMSNYHFRSRPLTVQVLDEINLDRALTAYKDRFADFGDFIFFFVGNFRADTLKPFVEQYLAALPSMNRKETWKDVGMVPPKGIISKQLYRGMEPKSTVNLTFTGPFEWSQQNRYNFNSMLGVLNIKLREIIREEKGGTYGVSAYGYSSLFPRREYSITVTWGCKPDRVDELIKETLLQIDSLKLSPPDPIYIEKVKETQRRSYETNVKRNNFWLNNLYFYYSNGENPELVLKYLHLVDNLTSDTIQAAATKYFDMNNYVKVVLYPEKK